MNGFAICATALEATRDMGTRDAMLGFGERIKNGVKLQRSSRHAEVRTRNLPNLTKLVSAGQSSFAFLTSI
jgi:hypothetical protein